MPACRQDALPPAAHAAWTDLRALAESDREMAEQVAVGLLEALVYENAGWHDLAAQIAGIAVLILIFFEALVIGGVFELQAPAVAKYAPWAYEPFLRIVGEHPESAPRLAVVEEASPAEARAKQQANKADWLALDPVVKCYMPGVPRANYLPFPFQIIQSPQHVIMAYEFASANRIVYMDQPDFQAPILSWMGHSLGRFEGDTLVIDVTDQVPDTWLDHAGNHHSDELKVVERYTLTGPNTVMYEATLEDPNVYTEPWTISYPLYRRLEANAQLLEYKCVEFTEELIPASK